MNYENAQDKDMQGVRQRWNIYAADVENAKQ